MSVEFQPERPSAPPSGLELQHAFQSYLHGLRESDIGDVVYASHIIERIESPYADSIQEATADFHSVLFGDDDHLKLLQDALGTVLRAYVYSGLAIDTDAIVRTANHFGFDKHWVRHQIEPVGTRLRNDLELAPSERQHVRVIGNLALQRMDALPKNRISRTIFLVSQRFA